MKWIYDISDAFGEDSWEYHGFVFLRGPSDENFYYFLLWGDAKVTRIRYGQLPLLFIIFY